MLLVVGGDPHMPGKDMGILLADGGDPHMPRQDDVAGGICCNIY